jgi:hypothetical protein
VRSRRSRSAGHSVQQKPPAITVRRTTALVQIIERVIRQNDKARAEIMFDVRSSK